MQWRVEVRALRELHLLLRAELDGSLVGASEVNGIDEALQVVGKWFQLSGDFEGEFSMLVTSADGTPVAVQVSRNQYLALYFIASTLEHMIWGPPPSAEAEPAAADAEPGEGVPAPTDQERESAA